MGALDALLAERFDSAKHPRGWHGYFESTPGAEVLKVAELVPSARDSEEHIAKAGRFMDDALAGRGAKRKPLTGVRDAQGRVTITDGKSTLEQLRRRGVTHAPVSVTDAPKAEKAARAAQVQASRNLAATRTERAPGAIPRAENRKGPPKTGGARGRHGANTHYYETADGRVLAFDAPDGVVADQMARRAHQGRLRRLGWASRAGGGKPRLNGGGGVVQEGEPSGLGGLLEGFAAAAPHPLPAAKGRFTVGDRVHVMTGAKPLEGVVRRAHEAKPDTHVVVAPEGGGVHVVAPIAKVRLNTPAQHAQAAARRERAAFKAAQTQAAQRPVVAVAGKAPGKPAAAPAVNPAAAPPVREGVAVLLEAFTAPAAPPATGPPETPAQSLQRARGQVAHAKAAQTAGWNASKHPRAQGGKFGYTTGGKRATRGKASTSRTVAHGAKGALVRSIQRQLHVKVDGAYGPQTKAAVTRFQRQHGLQVDGVVGAQTLAELRGNPNARKVTPGPIPSRVATVRPHASKRVKRAKSPKPGVTGVPGSYGFAGLVV